MSSGCFSKFTILSASSKHYQQVSWEDNTLHSMISKWPGQVVYFSKFILVTFDICLTGNDYSIHTTQHVVKSYILLLTYRMSLKLLISRAALCVG